MIKGLFYFFGNSGIKLGIPSFSVQLYSFRLRSCIQFTIMQYALVYSMSSLWQKSWLCGSGIFTNMPIFTFLTCSVYMQNLADYIEWQSNLKMNELVSVLRFLAKISNGLYKYDQIYCSKSFCIVKASKLLCRYLHDCLFSLQIIRVKFVFTLQFSYDFT